MIKQKLKVSFDDPEHEWVRLAISQGEESLPNRTGSLSGDQIWSVIHEFYPQTRGPGPIPLSDAIHQMIRK
jgi:hypothetical protein